MTAHTIPAVSVLAPLFRYPVDLAEPLQEARRALGDPALDAFANEIATIHGSDLEATYTETFDLAPLCSPYLGVHLFGEDARDRSRLLTGLRSCGVEGYELPDHVAEVFACAERFVEEEWRDLCRLVLRPALEKMEATLERTTNPYRHLVTAARRAVEGELS